MDFGVNLLTRGITGNADGLLSMARQAEALGFGHVTVNDHIVVPNRIAVPAAPASDNPRLRHGEVVHGRGDRRRRAFMLPPLQAPRRARLRHLMPVRTSSARTGNAPVFAEGRRPRREAALGHDLSPPRALLVELTADGACGKGRIVNVHIETRGILPDLLHEVAIDADTTARKSAGRRGESDHDGAGDPLGTEVNVRCRCGGNV